MPKKRTFAEQSADPAAQQMLIACRGAWYRHGVQPRRQHGSCNIGWGRHVLQAMRHGSLPPDQRRRRGRVRRQPWIPSRPAI